MPRSNKRGRKPPYTKKYDVLNVIVLRSYISVSYTELIKVDLGLMEQKTLVENPSYTAINSDGIPVCLTCGHLVAIHFNKG